MRTLTLLVWLGWMLLYWRGGTSIQEDIRNAARLGNWPDFTLLSTMTLASLGLALGGVVAALGKVSLPPAGMEAPFGLLLTLLGVAGTVYARRVLGAMWTAENAIQAEHRIVESGPYGVVRHPIYAAAILLYLGLAFAFPLWWMVTPVLLMVAAYIVKTRLEDDFLAENLAGYVAYRQRVHCRLIPGLW